MALRALVCPQCGASLSLDDSRDFGFCQFCGTKVMLHDVVEIKHSGSIKFDNSEQERNMLSLANSSFSAGNFQQAYIYYLRTLELNSKNLVAVYMRGISAVYNSSPQEIQINEYVQSMNLAKSLVFSNSVNTDSILKNIEQQSVNMLNYWFNKGLPTQPNNNELGTCISEFSKAVNVANLSVAVVDTLYNEEVKESLINQSLQFINSVLGTKLKYLAATQVDKKGRTVPVYKNVVVNNDQQRFLRDAETNLRELFNNLPSRTAKSSDINERLSSADEEVAQINAVLKEKKSQRNSLFFASLKDRKNPDLKAQLASLDAEIKTIESQLSNAKSVSKDINKELKEFKKTML